MSQPTRIDLHKRLRVAPGRCEEYLTFLREGIPYFERPGGIEVRLLEDKSDDHKFIELILYENEQVYERDRQRITNDPEMKRFLDRWRSLLAEAPVFDVYRLVKP
ncbi:hypothetical protein BH09PLA1_BH09PLA1_02170 [soil metagenome]